MDHFDMPHDKYSADHLLKKFMEHATNIKLTSHFLKAVEILYGHSYEIKVSVSRRMFFFCKLCQKQMSCDRSLQDHSNTGTHLKNLDEAMHEKLSSIKGVECRYPKWSLEYRISNSAVPILGCQMVERYDMGKGHCYYKCIMCGAHGKMELFYRHLIGDHHTDRYIRARVQLKSYTITNKERHYLRYVICDQENYGLKDIRTIQGKDYYPFKWENIVRLNKNTIKRETALSPSKSGVKEKSLSVKGEYEAIENMNGALSKGVQCYSYGFLENILLKMNGIVQNHTHTELDNDIHNKEDLKFALNLLNYALHLMHFANRRQLMDVNTKEENAHFKEQKQVMANCLGYVFGRILPYYKKKYGNWRYDGEGNEK